jgi:hypothetical protein
LCKIKHIVFVEHKGQTYTREENIINGKIILVWTLKQKNQHGTWDMVDYVTNQDLLNELNKAYSDMSYSENFKND